MHIWFIVFIALFVIASGLGFFKKTEDEESNSSCLIVLSIIITIILLGILGRIFS